MRYIGLIFIFLVSYVKADIEYKTVTDDFTEETNHRVLAYTESGEAMIVAMCNSPGKLGVQFVTMKTIFPDDMTDGGMNVRVTHKFVGGPEAELSEWFMNLMKYKYAFYSGDAESFIRSAASSKGIKLRFEKSGDVYKIEFGDDASMFNKILEACKA